MRTRPAARAARLLTAPLRRGLELLEDRTTPALTLGVSPAAVWEFSGAGAATATVTRDGDLSQALTVNLSSNDTTEATVPASVVIPAGAASATFPVNAVDDTAVDGTQTATITASATMGGTAQTGTISYDTSWGNSGWAGNGNPLSALAVQPDGKLVAAGYASSQTVYDFYVVRYNANGSLDTTFGNGYGYATTDVSGQKDLGRAVLVQADGKVVVAGTTGSGPNFDWGLVRYNANGTLDTTFGTGGKVVIDQAGYYNELWDIAQDSSGKIVVSGNRDNGNVTTFAVARLNTDGSLDSTFGTGGVATTAFGGTLSGRAFGVAIQPDGRVVAAGVYGGGNQTSTFAVARYNADGTPDATFGTNGAGVQYAINGYYDSGYDVAIQNGKIVVAGMTGRVGSSPTVYDVGLIRLNSNGTLDSTTFGGGVTAGPTGKVIGTAGGFYGPVRMALQSDNRIVVVGTTGSSQGSSYGKIFRFSPDGVPENSTNSQWSTSAGQAVALDGSGGIYLAYSYSSTGGYGYVDKYRSAGGGGTTVSATAAVSVQDNDPFSAAADAYAVDQNGTLTVADPGVLANDTLTAPNNPRVQLVNDPGSSVSGPSHGTVTLNADGSFTYTPAAGYSGTDAFYYRVVDGGSSTNTAAVTVTVRRLSNTLPVAADDSYTTNEDTPLTGLLAPEAAAGNSLSMVSQPGDYVGQGKTWSYGSSATYSMTASASSASISVSTSTDWWTLNFTAPNGARFVAGTTYTGAVRFGSNSSPGLDVYGNGRGSNQVYGQFTVLQVEYDGAGKMTRFAAAFEQHSESATAPALTGTVRYNFLPSPYGVLKNDSDADGDPLTASLVAGPAHGTLAFNPNGTFTYTPAANWSGTDSFTYQASDGYGLSNVATATITVAPVNDPPAAVNDSYTTAEDTPLVVQVGPNADQQNLVRTTQVTVTQNLTEFQQGVTAGRAGTLAAFDVYVVGAPGSVFDVFVKRGAPWTGSADLYSAHVSVTQAMLDQGWLTFDVSAANIQLAAGEVYTIGTRDGYGETAFLAASDGSGGDAYPGGRLMRNQSPGTSPNGYDLVFRTRMDGPVGVLANDADADSPTLAAAVVSYPTKGTLSLNANGSFTYTPYKDANGTDSFTYRASDGTATGNTATVTLTVTPVYDPPVAAPDTYTVVPGTAFTTTVNNGVLVNDRSPDLKPLSAYLVAGPTVGTLSAFNADGTFTYTRPAGATGADSFTYRTFDGVTYTAPVTVRLNVAPTGVAESYSIAEDTPLVVSAPGVLANDSDPDGDPLTAYLYSSPAHGSLSWSGTGGFTYTPAANYNGPDSFSYRPYDGVAYGPVVTVSLTVTPVNDAPVAANDAYTTRADQTLVVNPAAAPTTSLTMTSDAGDYIGQGRSYSFTPSTGTFGVSGNANYLTVSYSGGSEWWYLTFAGVGSNPLTPGTYLNAERAAFRSAGHPGLDVSGDGRGSNGLTGQFTVYQIVTDGAGKVIRFWASFEQHSEGSTPALRGTVKYAATGTGPLSVLDNDTDVDGDTLTATVLSGPSHGSLGMNPNGSFTYSADPTYSGTDTFTYQASDGQGGTSAPATVTITVTPANRAPVGAADSYTTNEDTPLRVAAPGVLGNDTDADGDALLGRLVSGPQHARGFFFDSTGRFDYTPAADYYGPDSFTYQPFDGKVFGAPVTVTITVNPANDPPVANAATLTTRQNTPLTVPATAVGSDVEGDPLTFEAVTGPNNGSVTVVSPGRNFTYTPNTGFLGTDSFTYHLWDGQAWSPTATITVNVVANKPPIGANDSGFTTPEDTVLHIDPAVLLGNDTDPDGDPLSVVAASIGAATNGTVGFVSSGGLVSDIVFTPAADFNGTASFLYKPFDGRDLAASWATVSITVTAVNDPPAAKNDGYPTPQETTLTVAAAGVLKNDTDADGDPLSAILLTSPAHGSLTFNADGSFAYAPDPGYVGPDSFTYQATDGPTRSNTATVTLTVSKVNHPPAAANDAYSTDEDTALTVPAAQGVLANDADPDGDPLTAVLVAGPANGSLTLNADGSFTYTPAANYTGTDSFTYKPTDGALDGNTATVTLTVRPVNDPPVAADDAFTLDEDTTLSVQLPGVLANDTDVDGDTLYATIIIATPAHGDLTLNADGSFTYTPLPDYNGPDSFQYQASDGPGRSNTATVRLTVRAVNDAPVAVADSYATDEDAALAVPAKGVLANDTDADGDRLTAVLVAGPAHGTLSLSADGGFAYTPAANYNGPDSFIYKPNDGQADGNTVTVTLTVRPVNDPPVAANDSYAGSEDTPLTVPAKGVLADDTDADGDTLSAILVSSPAHGSVTLNADGSFSYTPYPDWNGTDSFTYQATDGPSRSNAATVTLTVAAVNDPPVAAADSYATDEDTVLTVAAAQGVLADDTDVDSPALTARLVGGPAHGSLALNADGSFRYTPAANFNGTDSFTYKANDGSADGNAVTVSITVRPVNDPPAAANDSYAGSEDTTLTVPAKGVLANDTDADGDALTAILLSSPQHGSLTLNPTGSFTYTPDADWNGTDSFTYQATDGPSRSNAATVTLNVAAVNDAPVAKTGTARTLSLWEGQPLTFDMSPSTDVDDTVLTLVWDFNNDGTPEATTTWNRTASIAGSQYTYAYPDQGNYTARVTVKDAAGASSSLTFAVTVANLAPTGAMTGPATAVPGQTVSVTVAATDPGAADSAAPFQYQVYWGDGTTSPVVSGPAGGVTFTKTYTAAGTFQPWPWITDKDGGTSQGSTSITVTVVPAAVIGGSLYVGGTTGNDTITVKPADKTGGLTVTGVGSGSQTFTGVTGDVVVYGQAGDDQLLVQTAKITGKNYSVSVPVYLFGGDGNDTLNAGGAAAGAVLSGGAGVDALTGGADDDILIGGDGVDTLRGGAGSDILVGGMYGFESDLATLRQLGAEWWGPDSLDTRVKKINGTTPTAGVPTLTAATVSNDNDADLLYGETGTDWFIAPTTGERKDFTNGEYWSNL